MIVDIGLALVGLSLVLIAAKRTDRAIWEPLPPDVERARWRRCLVSTLVLTLCVIILFLLLGIVIGYQGAGWPGAKARILHPYIPVAIALYLPWALMQQTLFQFYLLGRLRTLWPTLPQLTLAAINGLAFGVLHATSLPVAAMAAGGGIAWSLLYLRYRLLWPLAVSHALVGTAFYYWVYGHDLARQWSPVILNLLNRG
jgi:membrane protease YdiL (CAAX protease family)